MLKVKSPRDLEELGTSKTEFCNVTKKKGKKRAEGGSPRRTGHLFSVRTTQSIIYIASTSTCSIQCFLSSV